MSQTGLGNLAWSQLADKILKIVIKSGESWAQKTTSGMFVSMIKFKAA